MSYKKHFFEETKFGESPITERQQEFIDNEEPVRVIRGKGGWLNGGVETEEFNW